MAYGLAPFSHRSNLHDLKLWRLAIVLYLDFCINCSNAKYYERKGYNRDYNVDTLIVTKILRYDELTYYLYLLGHRLNFFPQLYREQP